ncbi:hypothetical protein [Algoriphagus sp. CAU 1675]|uniref:hypothetical protein n=1 Tax=Algoriphagus sp. CAU 1675 TaxID=3032597 RepID=UPI0023DC4F0B|nr:hypothetical protein [Algoriphagus sp. CAU 1675]MDF2157172.1 hypothetical protein [Algoriphagus sp. CAU 1675]
MKKLVLLGRVSLFVIFFWFGILKVIGISPAEPLVHNLFDQLFPEIISFQIFNRLFGAFECFIGIIWLVPGLTRFSLYILLFHMVLTFLPELLLPEDTWQMWLTPTLIGQYIIKNLALISLGLLIYKQTEVEKLAFVRIS